MNFQFLVDLLDTQCQNHLCWMIFSIDIFKDIATISCFDILRVSGKFFSRNQQADRAVHGRAEKNFLTLGLKVSSVVPTVQKNFLASGCDRDHGCHFFFFLLTFLFASVVYFTFHQYNTVLNNINSLNIKQYL